LAVWDAALIVENGQADNYRPLVMVSCSPEQQLQRLMKRGTGHGPITEEAARAMMRHQLPMDQKLLYADYVIDTSGSIEESVQQTIDIIKRIRQ
jgi:dephospho-CoA kinase